MDNNISEDPFEDGNQSESNKNLTTQQKDNLREMA